MEPVDSVDSTVTALIDSSDGAPIDPNSQSKTPLNDANFHSAVNLWFSDEANATFAYGHISDWNVSAVTNMSNEIFFLTVQILTRVLAIGTLHRLQICTEC